MKRFFLIFLLALAAIPCTGASYITGTLTVTNQTTNGTITIAGSVRTFTNNVSAPSTQISTSASIGGTATNVFNHFGLYPTSRLIIRRTDTNNVIFEAVNLTASVSAGWGTMVLVTNSSAPGYNVTVPFSNFAATNRTNIASLLVNDIATYSTNAFPTNAITLSNYVAMASTQTITGPKIFSGPNVYSNASAIWYSGTVSNAANISGTLSRLTNGYLTNTILDKVFTTNLVNRGNAITSVGSGLHSEQFGASAAASGASSSAFGKESEATNSSASAFGRGALAYGENSAAFGYGSAASGLFSSAIGAGSVASATNSLAIGASSYGSNINSSAIGYSAATTATNQIVLGSTGSGGISVSIPQNASVGNNLAIGVSWEKIHVAGLARGLFITNGTAASSTPTNGMASWCAGGIWQYRTGLASEGSNAVNNVHNRGAEVVGSGANYSLTTTHALVDFGGTDAELNTLPTAGTYLITATIQCVNGATAGDDYFFKFYDATAAADIANSERTLISGVAASSTPLTIQTIYTTATTPRIQIYGKNGTASRGTVSAIYTKISYVRLY